MPNSIATGVLKHLGLIGPTTALSTGQLVPQAKTPQAIQHMMQDWTNRSHIDNPDVWSQYGSMMRGPKSFEEMLKLWDEMAGWDLMAAALQEFVEEVTSTDSNSPGVLWYECNDEKFEDEINDLLIDLDIESLIPSQTWHVSAMGNHFEKIDYAPGVGVTGLSFVHPFDVRRFWLSRNRQCVGFRWEGHQPDRASVYAGLDNKTQIERINLNHGGNSVEQLWYPWDFLHFRRMFQHRSSEHGEPIFDQAQGIYRKLRMAIDQMVVHRAQIQPDRYSVNIDVQEQTPTEQMKTVQRWKQSLRSQMAFGPGPGGTNVFGDPTDFKSFYNPMALDTIIWVAKPKGFNNTIEKLPGTTNIPDVYDIELLTDLFYSVIGMPKSWFGMGKDGAPAPSGKALLAQDIRFLRKVKSIRRPIMNAYTWLAYFHAVLKGKNIEELDIRAKMSEIGGLEEQMKVELLERQTAVLAQLGEVMEIYNLPKEAWVEVIFKRYMHLPEEVVNVFITSLPNEQQPEMESRKRKPAPYSYKLIREIEEKLGPHKKLVQELRDASFFGEDVVLNSKRRERGRMRKRKHVLNLPAFKGEEIVLSTNSSFVVRGDSTSESVSEPHNGPVAYNNEGKPLQESDPAWRRYIKITK